MRSMARACVATGSALALSGGIMAPGARADDSPKEIFEKVAPATVQVIVSGEPGGTGIVYDADEGLILTNAHVVAGQTALRVRIEDGESVPVRVVGSDPCEDLAVMKLTTPREDLKEVEFGNSSDLEQGDDVTAIGYPGTLGDDTRGKATLTTGVVESPDVAMKGATSYPNLPSTVQHSAAVNPGNSGGPLLNSDAKLVGINTLTNISPTVQSQHYAISSDHAEPLLPDLAAGNNKNNPGWGELVAIADPSFPSYFAEEDQADAQSLQKTFLDADVAGMYVMTVASNSPASNAKLAAGDVITHLKDTPVATATDVCEILQSAAAGEKLSVEGVFTSSGEYSDGSPYEFGDTWQVDITLSK